MEKYALTVNSNTFIWTYADKGLIYNSHNFKSFRFKITNNILSLCIKLNKPDNLYTIIITEQEHQDPDVKEWIQKLILTDSAILKPYDTGYAVSLKPELKVQYNIQKLISNNDIPEMVDCLSNITFHLNGSELDDNEEWYAKQREYPVKSKDCLNYNNLNNFLHHVPQNENLTLNFIHGDTFYPYLIELLELLKLRNNQIIFHFRLKDICYLWSKCSEIVKSYGISIICKLDKDTSEYINFIRRNIPNAQLVFLITSESEYDLIENLNLTGLNFEVAPIFNGYNQKFFKKYVYINEVDCDKIKKDKRSIFINQALNSSFFGKLEVLPDGTVRDNINYAPIGTIEDMIITIIPKVFSNKGAWFYIRQDAPCNNCLYQWLCPPPSNYELVLKQKNLCTVY